jgi:hypothetical protein
VKRFVATVAVLAAIAGGIVAMAELTQNRPDVVVEDSETTIDFTVDTRRYDRGEPFAATALWAVCAATVDGAVSPAPVAHAGAWRVTVSPAIGEHGENRLVGCLEDATIDRVLGDVVALSSTTS